MTTEKSTSHEVRDILELEERLKVDLEPRKLMITSELYIVSSPYGYQVGVDVLELRSKRARTLLVSAKSLAEPLEQLRRENQGSVVGLEFWLRKAGPERTAKYVVEE